MSDLSNATKYSQEIMHTFVSTMQPFSTFGLAIAMLLIGYDTYFYIHPTSMKIVYAILSGITLTYPLGKEK